MGRTPLVIVLLIGCDAGRAPTPVQPSVPTRPAALPRADAGPSATADGSLGAQVDAQVGAPVVVVQAGAYCPGAVQWPAGSKICTSDRDCDGSTRCWPDGWPSYEGVCGAYTPPKVDCHTDKDCGRKEVCIDAGAGPCDGRNRACVPRCTATTCGAGESCAANGHCEPTSCKRGFACASGFKCTGNAQRADLHGCELIGCWEKGGETCGMNMRCVRGRGCDSLACKTSADCDCGACFDGFCRPRPGICLPQEAPGPPPSAAPSPPPPAD